MIQLFVTGGTIDKQYDAISGELTFPDTHIPALLEEANCTLDIEIAVLMQKDSLQMTDSDRNKIDQACSVCSAQQIVITHGTDTMVETALQLQSNPKLTDKTIVLTGAMRPYKLGDSDAAFNIGSALQAVQLAAPGVWVTMNGKLFPANQVIKNTTLGQFEAH